MAVSELADSENLGRVLVWPSSSENDTEFYRQALERVNDERERNSLCRLSTDQLSSEQLSRVLRLAQQLKQEASQ